MKEKEYRCIITDANGKSVTSGTAKLHVTEAIAITSQPTDFSGSVGTTAKFTVKVSGSGLTYQWQYRNAGTAEWVNSKYTGYNTETISLAITTAIHMKEKEYRCIITDENGKSVTSGTAKLHVTEAITITSQPADYSGAVGDTAKFTVKADGSGLTYQWQYRNAGTTEWINSKYTGYNTPTISFVITTASHMQGKEYRCVISDASGNQIISDVATLKVN